MSGAALRIVCIGNSLRPEDAAGPRVFEALLEAGLPSGVEAIDGGLGGIDLLGALEGARRVVFVDAVEGFTDVGATVVLAPEDLGDSAQEVFGHGAGLPYLLRIAPAVLEGALPEMIVLGLEGEASPAMIEAAAARSLELVRHGPSFPPASRD